MEFKEFSGKTVEKAVKAACEHYGVNEEDLEIEIITKGSTGLFGLGGRPAKIKAAVKQEAGEKTEETPQPAVPDKEAQAVTSEEESDRPGDQEIPGHGQTEADETQDLDSDTDAGRGQTNDPKYDEEEIEAHVKKACEITNSILERSGLSGKATLGRLDGKPVVDIAGEDLSLLIGKEGQTLDALEYIVNLALKRQSDVNMRVTLEATGYRARREQALRDLARRMADKARKTGKPVTLNPMPARERRIVHMALKGERGIKTHSSGDGHRRKVVITPQKKRFGRPKGRRPRRPSNR